MRGDSADLKLLISASNPKEVAWMAIKKVLSGGMGIVSGVGRSTYLPISVAGF